MNKPDRATTDPALHLLFSSSSSFPARPSSLISPRMFIADGHLLIPSFSHRTGFALWIGGYDRMQSSILSGKEIDPMNNSYAATPSVIKKSNHWRGRAIPSMGSPRWLLCRACRSRAILLPVFLILSISIASGQTWQTVYGPTNTLDIDYGRRGVRPTSLNCSGVNDGYIAVGTFTGGGVGDVYVVRTDNGGVTTPGWENRYNVTSNSDDHGESIVELADGSGFAVTGYTNLAGGTFDVLIMKIACDGTVVWTRTLGTSAADEYGYDIIQAANGDLLVAGRRDLGTHAEALMIRLSSATSNLIWYRFYDQGTTSDEGFYTLTEVEPASGSDPDIIAVGKSGAVSGTARRGFIVRTSATGVAQGAAVYGGGIHEEFYSVIELQNPAEIGSNSRPNVVIAGFSQSYNTLAIGNSDMYFVKLDGGDICQPLIQKIVGQSVSWAEDVATCIREIPFVPGTGIQQWDIAVTGWVTDPSAPANAVLVALTPTTLNPGGISRTYGHPTNGAEKAWSLHPVETTTGRTEGFILCGSTTTPWHVGNYYDIGDLYLIKTDNAASLGNCEVIYAPQHDNVQWTYSCLSQDNVNIGNNVTQSTSSTSGDWDDRVCTDVTNDGYAKRMILQDESYGRLNGQPNPVNNGQSLILTLTSFNAENGMAITVINSLGEEVTSSYDRFTPATGEILVKTTGWPAGLYHITVQNGERRWTTQVVVLE